MNFADREINEFGWMIYPSDKPLRAQLYPENLLKKTMTHPARQMMHATIDIIEEYTKPGDTILDPFGGIGTVLIAATMGRNVVLMEIEPYYQDIIQECIDYLKAQELPTYDNLPGDMVLVRGDNQVLLPFPCDHMILSPPYGNDLAAGTTLSFEGREEEFAEYTARARQYAASPQNIGKQPEFIYRQVMKKVYAKMAQGLKPGGTITVTHRDRIKDGQRVLYVDSIVKALMDAGLRFEALRKWEVPRTIQANVNLNKGSGVVLDEDIITMRKPL